MIDQTFDLVITEISTLSEMDEKMLPNAKIWYEDIAKAINAARLDPSAVLVNTHLSQLPTSATLQQIMTIAKISDADTKEFHDYFSGLPELMSDIEKIRNKYLDDIANSDSNNDLNPDEHAAYERAVEGIEKLCRKRLTGRTISVPISGYTFHDLKYGTVFCPSLAPGARISGTIEPMNRWSVDRYVSEWRHIKKNELDSLNRGPKWRAGMATSVLNMYLTQKLPPVVQLLEKLFDKFPEHKSYATMAMKFYVPDKLKKNLF